MEKSIHTFQRSTYIKEYCSTVFTECLKVSDCLVKTVPLSGIYLLMEKEKSK